MRYLEECSGARCIPRPVATGRVSCVCDWLSDATDLDFDDRSWICNAAKMIYVTSRSGISSPDEFLVKKRRRCI